MAQYTREMATNETDKGALQLEVISAFSKEKQRKKHTAEQAWLYSHCTRQTSELFELYNGETTAISPFEKQTFFQWKSMMEFERFTHPRRQRRRVILIQPLTHLQASSGYTHKQINSSILQHLHNLCEAFFYGMTVKLAPALDLSEISPLTQRVHKDTNREQFLVGGILKYLHIHRPREAYCVVGVTVADLYPSPEWNFVLGEANMNMGCGVFSFGRTFNSLSADSGDGGEGGDGGGGGEGSEGNADPGERIELEQFRNLWILMRVMTHELCHILGLKHCNYFNCAMNDSSTIQEAATQPLFLCPVCLKKVQTFVKFDLSLRYQKLLEVVRVMFDAVREIGGKESEGEMAEVGTIVEDTKSTKDERQTENCSSLAVKESAGEKAKAGKDTKDESQTGNCTSLSVAHQPTGESMSAALDRDQSDSSFHGNNTHHLRHFERAIEWLERTLGSLREFKGQWVEPGSKATSKKSKVV